MYIPRYPFVSDAGQRISQQLGFLDPADYRESLDSVAVPVRGSYLLDPDFIVRSFSVYPISNGRCVDETLRMLDSLQLTTACPFVGTPASWHKGERVVLMPGVDTELATETLGFTNVNAAEICEEEEQDDYDIVACSRISRTTLDIKSQNDHTIMLHVVFVLQAYRARRVHTTLGGQTGYLLIPPHGVSTRRLAGYLLIPPSCLSTWMYTRPHRAVE